MNNDQIQTIAADYSEIATKIEEINKELKELRGRKKDIEETIMDYMQNHNLDNFQTKTDRFMIKETVKSKSFSKKTLVNDLLNFMDHTQVDTITSKLFKEDDDTVTKTIKHKKI